jgi:uncharacterized protein YggE
MKTTVVMMLGLALATVGNRAAAQATTPPAPSITVSATGEAHVSPDRATIFVGVQSRASTAAAAGSENARRQRAVLDTLRALGISGDRVSTMNYNVTPDVQYSPNNSAPPKVVGYTVTNTVRAEIVKLEDVGRIIDAVLGKGANELSSLQFYSSKADSARRAALGAAVANARADAEALARAAGGSLGLLAEISSGEPPIRPIAMPMAKLAAQSSTPIEPGQQTIEATVSVRWLFVSSR